MQNIGKVVFITNKNSPYYDEWGVIKQFDGDQYHVAIANDRNSMPIFDRDEIRMPHKQDYYKKLFNL